MGEDWWGLAYCTKPLCFIAWNLWESGYELPYALMALVFIPVDKQEQSKAAVNIEHRSKHAYSMLQYIIPTVHKNKDQSYTIVGYMRKSLLIWAYMSQTYTMGQ